MEYDEKVEAMGSRSRYHWEENQAGKQAGSHTLAGCLPCSWGLGYCSALILGPETEVNLQRIVPAQLDPLLLATWATLSPPLLTSFPHALSSPGGPLSWSPAFLGPLPYDLLKGQDGLLQAAGACWTRTANPPFSRLPQRARPWGTNQLSSEFLCDGTHLPQGEGSCLEQDCSAWGRVSFE